MLAPVVALLSSTSHAFAFRPLPSAGVRRPLQRHASPVAAAYAEDDDSFSSVDYSFDVPYKEAQYDPDAAKAFFGERPLESFGRLARLAQLSGGFVFSTLLDKALDREEAVVEERSQQLLELVTKMGPTFVKLGQALSIRTDLLPAPYVAGLQQLQDAVQPFSSAQGLAIIEQELGIKLDDVFSEISTDPVASASIGQVYRATLRSTGEEVAIKVQRPRVLYNVALDLYMMRNYLVPFYQKVNPESNTALVELVDAWGEGFVNELDYRKEAAATTAFSEAMRQRGLGSVTAPEVVEELSSVHVLTTKWVDGERLAASDADDVPRLCGVALNAYLTMLLDTGTLHCDPHPGNLMRTKDGKLCILDFGMCLDVPKDLQLSLLEFIADLQAENYDRVPDDLVALSFVPKDKIDDLRKSGLTFGITQMLKLAGQGGGASSVMKNLVEENKRKYGPQIMAKYGTLESPEAVKMRQRLFKEDYRNEMAKDAMAYGESSASTTADLTQKIEQLQQENSNVFAIPDYFVYMSRAFVTLEGIGLSANPDYAILSECFPYLAKRLLSDDSPRARGALRTLLYGTSDELDLSQLSKVTSGLEKYTSSTASVESSRGVGDDGRDAAYKQLATVVLGEEETYIQSLLVQEAANALDASLRDSISSTLAPLRELPQVPQPLAPLLAPLTLPLDLVGAALELQQLDERDRKRLENLRILTDLASGMSNTASSSDGQTGGAPGLDNVRTIANAAAARRVALGRIGLRFSSTLATTQAERLRGRLEDTKSSKELSALASLLASRGATTLEGFADAVSTLDKDIGARNKDRHESGLETDVSPSESRVLSVAKK